MHFLIQYTLFGSIIEGTWSDFKTLDGVAAIMGGGGGGVGIGGALLLTEDPDIFWPFVCGLVHIDSCLSLLLLACSFVHLVS